MKRGISLVIMVLVVALMVFTDSAVNANEWRTLEQIPRGPFGESGVYIKRGDRFLRLNNNGGNLSTRIYTTSTSLYNGIVGKSWNVENFLLEESDQLVHIDVGSREIVIDEIKPMGVFAAQLVIPGNRLSTDNISMIFDRATTSLTRGGNSHNRYTHFNREEIENNPKIEQHLLKVGSNPDAYFIVGEFAQRFSLGKFQGTRFVEDEFYVARELFSVVKRLPHSIEQTFGGYFIINFTRPSPGTFIHISNSILEIR